MHARLEFPTERGQMRSEEHTSELQSPCNLVCRLLLEKKKTHNALNVLVAHMTRVLAQAAGLSGGRGEIGDGPPPPCPYRPRGEEDRCFFFFLMLGRPPRFTLFPYATLFR